MRKGSTLAALVAVMGLFALTGCGEKTTGEKADDAADQMKDAADDAAEDAGEAAEDAGDAMKDAMDGDK